MQMAEMIPWEEALCFLITLTDLQNLIHKQELDSKVHLQYSY